ncbi:(d)CMP kinase [Sneathiella sp. CAU 1612]|uniref:Cytidylate kinase n=1 Tax=Sneathiella sedimenti TaxID=2816034 RepID=A0ABS3F2Q0_9PROT|nr:(d)CMP kinase [Sneathiella sedimenti]MBO0332789.1 (d)CMP kinase [Sneathiella sedimenti]
MIIAIDGPAAAGKGTLARRIAQIYNLNYLDTGSLYRAVALKLLRLGSDPTNFELAVKAAGSLDDIALDDPALRNEETAEIAAIVAANQAVRAALLQYQRDFAQTPTGAVLDGRDIGTVVCPDADVKLFVTASAEVRARRRFDELAAKGIQTTYDAVLKDLEARDARDQGRGTAPLKKADDAHLLDTSKLDIEAAVTAACKIIDAA